MPKSLVQLTAEIVQSQTCAKQMSTEEVKTALKDTYQALKSLQAAEVTNPVESDSAESVQVLDPKKSIQKNKVVCLECGKEFRMLSGRHLASHGLDSRAYRKKYGFPARQPLCAKTLSEKRSAGAKERGIPENLQKAIDARAKKKVVDGSDGASNSEIQRRLKSQIDRKRAGKVTE